MCGSGGLAAAVRHGAFFSVFSCRSVLAAVTSGGRGSKPDFLLIRERQMKRPYHHPARVLSVLVSCIGCGKGGDKPKTTTKRAYTRDEVKKLVGGKTEEEVLKLLGKPESTGESGGIKTWFYKSIAKDPTTDKIERRYISFDGGKVFDVSFH